MADKKQTLVSATIFWDNGSHDQAWAYRTKFAVDGEIVHEESGEWYADFGARTSKSDLQEALRDLLFEEGVEVDVDSLYADPTLDGGYACWSR